MDNSLAMLFSLDALASQATVQSQILSLNKKSEQYGLSLSPADASALIQTRAEALTANGRIEIGSATIGKFIDAFCTSAFLNQSDYATTLHELLELFYYVKNEALDQISDDELIAFMKDCYENRCGGSLELLAGRELEKLAHNLRFGVTNYRDMTYETRFEQDAEETDDEDDWKEKPDE